MKQNSLSINPICSGMILCIIMLATVLPVFSQTGGLKNTSFIQAGRKPAIDYPANYAFAEPGMTSADNIVSDFSSSASSPAKDKKEKNKNKEPGTDKKYKIGEKEKISFMSTSFSYPKNAKADIGIAYYPPSRLILYAKILKEYARKKGFDTTYAFLCNMALVSNKKRFFVFNMVTMRIEQSGLVSQGRGKGISTYDKSYSNEPGSNCTALGRYKISGRYYGEYGESFRLTGLDSSNKKAYARRIVLHSMPCIPDTDAMMPPCASEGCPAVSPAFLSSLREIIDGTKKPILLWIFDSNLEELVMEEN